MTSQIIQTMRVGAEIYKGDGILCRNKSVALLEEIGLPNNLLPLDNIQEFGYNRSTGFIWLTQKKNNDHTFKQIKRSVSYDHQVTAFIEARKLKNMTGVKTKELFVWFSIAEMYMDDPSSEKVTFKTGTGLSTSFPAPAFQLGA